MSKVSFGDGSPYKMVTDSISMIAFTSRHRAWKCGGG
jgi:hypothetical protein